MTFLGLFYKFLNKILGKSFLKMRKAYLISHLNLGGIAKMSYTEWGCKLYSTHVLRKLDVISSANIRIISLVGHSQFYPHIVNWCNWIYIYIKCVTIFIIYIYTLFLMCRADLCNRLCRAPCVHLLPMQGAHWLLWPWHETSDFSEHSYTSHLHKSLWLAITKNVLLISAKNVWLFFTFYTFLFFQIVSCSSLTTTFENFCHLYKQTKTLLFLHFVSTHLFP